MEVEKVLSISNHLSKNNYKIPESFLMSYK